MEANPIRFTVELDTDAHPIQGLVRPDGADIPFVGWVGLAGAIERLIAAQRSVVIEDANATNGEIEEGSR